MRVRKIAKTFQCHGHRGAIDVLGVPVDRYRAETFELNRQNTKRVQLLEARRGPMRGDGIVKLPRVRRYDGRCDDY
jgi:hypothetical protein